MTAIINQAGIPASRLGEYHLRVGGEQKRLDQLYEDQALLEKQQAERMEWISGSGGQFQKGVAYNRPPQPVKAYLASHNRHRPEGTILTQEQLTNFHTKDLLSISGLGITEDGNPFRNYQFLGVTALRDRNVKAFDDPILAQMLGAEDNRNEKDGVVYDNYEDVGNKTEIFKTVTQGSYSAGAGRRDAMREAMGYKKKNAK